MGKPVRVDRELDRIPELERDDEVYFRISDEDFERARSIGENDRLTVRRVTLYDEWNTTYPAKDIELSYHHGKPVLGLKK